MVRVPAARIRLHARASASPVEIETERVAARDPEGFGGDGELDVARAAFRRVVVAFRGGRPAEDACRDIARCVVGYGVGARGLVGDGIGGTRFERSVGSRVDQL